MEIKLVKYSRVVYNKLLLELHCSCLFVKNLLLIRTLKVNSLALYDRVVIQENEIELLWNVSGCYKIIISGIGVFPGKISGLRFTFTNRNNPIEFTFCGIRNRIKRKIIIKNTVLELRDKFNATAEIPVAIAGPYNLERLESDFSKNKLKLEFQNVYLKLEPLDIKKFKSVNTIH